VILASKVTGAVTGRGDADAAFRSEGCSTTRPWGNAPGDRYGAHAHDQHKVLFCLSGSITFHTPDGDVELSQGDRLDLPPGTEHSATVGPRGVECVEAWKPA
jgi:mannose-6-phosphate isomerase-like protein (cupin superfamily)